MIYDNLFKRFQEQLIEEYGKMRSTYMSEYQQNFDMNSSRRDDKISEMNMAIDTREDYINELKK